MFQLYQITLPFEHNLVDKNTNYFVLTNDN